MQKLKSELLRAIQPENTATPSASSEQEWESWAKRGEVTRTQERLNAAHERDEQAKRWIHKIILANIFVAGACVAGAFIIRTLHLLLPTRIMWLDKAQVETLDTLAKLVTTGALGSLLTRYLNKNFDSNNSNESPPK